jgi:hypothetical protein
MRDLEPRERERERESSFCSEPFDLVVKNEVLLVLLNFVIKNLSWFIFVLGFH